MKIKSGKILAWLYRYIEVLNELIAQQAEMREEKRILTAPEKSEVAWRQTHYH